MIEFLQQTPVARAAGTAADWVRLRLLPRLMKQRILGAAAIACALAVLYWGLIASDRYVSEAHVIIQRTDMASSQTMDFGALLTGVNSSARADQMLLRDYLLSVDMLRKLDADLQYREHFSNIFRDPLSRLWSPNVSLERLHSYYLSRVSVEYDEHAGVLVIKAEAYEPDMAHALTSHLVQEGERYMNEMAHRLAKEQVDFLEQQVTQLGQRASTARQQLIALQNAKGMVSPEATAESLAALVSRLEGQLVELRAQRAALAGYLSPQAPAVVELNLQISAIEQQIAQQKARLTAPHGKTLNSTVEEFQRLQLAAEFATDVYKTALVALEKGRVEATRTLKKVSVLQSPTRPEYPLQPRRLYNIFVFILVTALLAGIAHLLTAIIRDHKD